MTDRAIAGGARQGRVGRALLFAAFVVALAILLALGTWQVKRLAWKEGLLATIESRVHSEPIAFPELMRIASEGGDIEYRPVTVSGTFDYAGEQHFFATQNGAPGYYVYTPLTTGDGAIVFINRGFVPYELKDAALRPQSQPEGVVTVTGLARRVLTEKPSFIVPDNDPAKNIYYWKDIDAMAQNAGLGDDPALVRLFIDAGFPDGTYPRTELPQPGVTIIDLPNSHLQYAVTWYGLAAALAGVFAFFWFGRRPGSGSRS